MKKGILFLLLGVLTIALFFAGAKDRTRPLQAAIIFNQPTDECPLTIGGGVGDTIVVSDTVSFPIIVTHSAPLKPYIQLYWDKISSGTATVTATYWQSNDGVNYQQLKKGKLQAVYTKTLTCSSDSTHWVSFMLDTVALEGKFLKIKYITSSTASVKAKLTHRIKFLL